MNTYRNISKHSVTCFRTFLDDFLVHTVKLKPIIKAKISGKLVTSGKSDVATASVHSKKPVEEVDYDYDYYYSNRKSITSK